MLVMEGRDLSIIQSFLSTIFFPGRANVFMLHQTTLGDLRRLKATLGDLRSQSRPRKRMAQLQNFDNFLASQSNYHENRVHDEP